MSSRTTTTPRPPKTASSCTYCAGPPDVVITWVRYGDQDLVCESHWEFLAARCPRVFIAQPFSPSMIRRW
jgi:hypothetical protein